MKTTVRVEFAPDEIRNAMLEAAKRHVAEIYRTPSAKIVIIAKAGAQEATVECGYVEFTPPPPDKPSKRGEPGCQSPKGN